MKAKGLAIQQQVHTREQCPVCATRVDGNLGLHIRELHGEDSFRQAVLNAKMSGMSDAEIGVRFGISFHQLQQIITEVYGTNISVLGRPKRIKTWEPRSFREETTTVWSFKQRGDWATHDGRYRGNWSPYIPRNIILKYSKPGDVVLDYFVGSGTTAVEAKLLGRRCIARDINPAAIDLTIKNLAFEHYPGFFGGQIYEPRASVGDARDLSDIPSDSIDLICAHPPYAGIINYSSAVVGDLSKLSIADFLKEMSKVAHESWRVLKPGGKCAILVGDARKSKHVVPIGFQLIRVFLEAGFTLRELIIKRQHNCRATGFWYARSIQYNFLLLAHEYLPVFEKPSVRLVAEQGPLWEHYLNHTIVVERGPGIEEKNIETTSVWVLPQDGLELEIKRNLLQRFCKHKGTFIEIKFDDDSIGFDNVPDQSVSLVYVRFPERDLREQTALGYRASIRDVIKQIQTKLAPGGFVVFEVKDFRCDDGRVYPLGLFLYEDLAYQENFSLKEIVIVVPKNYRALPQSSEALVIIHRYLLILSAKSDK